MLKAAQVSWTGGRYNRCEVSELEFRTWALYWGYAVADGPTPGSLRAYRGGVLLAEAEAA